MKHKIEVSLGIWDFEEVTHKDISDLLALEPSKIFIRGEKINPNFLSVAKQNAWFINSVGYGHASYEEQIKSIIQIIESNPIVFKQFSEKYYLEVSCAIEISISSDESTPWIHLDKNINETISNYKIEIDFDIYLTK